MSIRVAAHARDAESKNTQKKRRIASISTLCVKLFEVLDQNNDGNVSKNELLQYKDLEAFSKFCDLLDLPLKKSPGQSDVIIDAQLWKKIVTDVLEDRINKDQGEDAEILLRSMIAEFARIAREQHTKPNKKYTEPNKKPDKPKEKPDKPKEKPDKPEEKPDTNEERSDRPKRRKSRLTQGRPKSKSDKPE
tara:strand:- start:254 stop:826 length:573 start_codon:yes stop_codon:yes gene_type:complete